MKVLIVLSTVVVVAWAQYGSVAADPSTATQVQVQYQYPVNPYPGNYYYEHYGHRHPRNHHRRRHHSRHHHDFDSSEDYNGWGWAHDGFEGYRPNYYGYPPVQTPIIYTVPTTVVASDSASYGTASDTVAAAPASYGSK